MSIFSALLNLFRSIFSPTTTVSTTTMTTTTRAGSSNKKAVCIGINNYKGTKNDLRGCVNDARAWEKMLKGTYGFGEVTVILDSQATTKRVSDAIRSLMLNAEDGDVLAITYSGHGSYVADTDGDEIDGKDETWYLYDGHLKDDKIKGLLGKLKVDARITIISDSCHSGTVTRSMMATSFDDTHYAKPRFMPPEDDVDAVMLASLPFSGRSSRSEEKMKEVLLAACLPTEYSYETWFNGRPMGVFSHNALMILRDNPDITYEDFYKKIRKRLPSSRYPQTPQLEGSEANKKSKMFM